MRDTICRRAHVVSLKVSDLDSSEELHADSDLDTEKIYHTLASNPELRKTTMSLAELEALHQQLHGEYERRFKQS